MYFRQRRWRWEAAAWEDEATQFNLEASDNIWEYIGRFMRWIQFPIFAPPKSICIVLVHWILSIFQDEINIFVIKIDSKRVWSDTNSGFGSTRKSVSKRFPAIVTRIQFVGKALPVFAIGNSPDVILLCKGTTTTARLWHNEKRRKRGTSKWCERQNQLIKFSAAI